MENDETSPIQKSPGIQYRLQARRLIAPQFTPRNGYTDTDVLLPVPSSYATTQPWRFDAAFSQQSRHPQSNANVDAENIQASSPDECAIDACKYEDSKPVPRGEPMVRRSQQSPQYQEPRRRQTRLHGLPETTRPPVENERSKYQLHSDILPESNAANNQHAGQRPMVSEQDLRTELPATMPTDVKYIPNDEEGVQEAIYREQTHNVDPHNSRYPHYDVYTDQKRAAKYLKHVPTTSRSTKQGETDYPQTAVPTAAERRTQYHKQLPADDDQDPRYIDHTDQRYYSSEQPNDRIPQQPATYLRRVPIQKKFQQQNGLQGYRPSALQRADDPRDHGKVEERTSLRPNGLMTKITRCEEDDCAGGIVRWMEKCVHYKKPQIWNNTRWNEYAPSVDLCCAVIQSEPPAYNGPYTSYAPPISEPTCDCCCCCCCCATSNVNRGYSGHETSSMEMPVFQPSAGHNAIAHESLQEQRALPVTSSTQCIYHPVQPFRSHNQHGPSAAPPIFRGAQPTNYRGHPFAQPTMNRGIANGIGLGSAMVSHPYVGPNYVGYTQKYAQDLVNLRGGPPRGCNM